jgi:hypothetical protein
MNKVIIAGVGLLVLSYFIQRGAKGRTAVKVIQRQSIEDIIKKYSDDCDEIILRELKQSTDLTYISGYFIIKLSDDQKRVKLNADMYFQDKSGQWIKKESQDSFRAISLHEKDLEELKSREELKYELSSPELPELTAN